MRLFRLNETVFSIKGKTFDFLKGITSNELDLPLNAFLNQHGRIIATVRQKKINEEEFLISVPMVAVDALLAHVDRYVKISHVRMEPVAKYTYVNLDDANTLILDEQMPNAISEGGFTPYRLEHQIPLMGIDYQADEFILNVHEFNYVSYTKGCFLGQEPVAKVHNRSQPTRKLVVEFEDKLSSELAEQMTSTVIDPATKKVKGFVFINTRQAGGSPESPQHSS